MRAITLLICAVSLSSCVTQQQRQIGMATGIGAIVLGGVSLSAGADWYDPDDERAPTNDDTSEALMGFGLVVAGVGLVTLIASAASSPPADERILEVEEEIETVVPITLAMQCDQMDGNACYELGRSFLNGDPQDMAAACQSFAAACNASHELGCLARDAHCASQEF